MEMTRKKLGDDSLDEEEEKDNVDIVEDKEEVYEIDHAPKLIVAADMCSQFI
jgi:hypothetical protein